MLHVIVSCGMRLQSTSEDNGHIVGFVRFICHNIRKLTGFGAM